MNVAGLLIFLNNPLYVLHLYVLFILKHINILAAVQRIFHFILYRMNNLKFLRAEELCDVY